MLTYAIGVADGATEIGAHTPHDGSDNDGRRRAEAMAESMWYNPWAPPIFPGRRPEPLPLPTYPWGVGPPIFPPINDVNQPAQALQAGPPALQLPGQMRRADGGPSAAEQTIEDARHQIATQSQRLPPAAPDYGPDVDWSRYNQPTGELKAATYSPTQRIGNAMADALMAAGMPPYTANDLSLLPN